MHKIDRLRLDNIELLKVFLSIAGKSLETFRYFNKRPLEVIENHIVTYMMTIDDLPVCYGHLEKENGVVWLGIAVAEQYRRRGLGRTMMKELIDHARSNDIHSIYLSVDYDNTAAMDLYKKLGFKLHEKKTDITFFKLEL